MDDKRATMAILKIINEHKLVGAEAPAILQLMRWVQELPDRLKPNPVVMPEQTIEKKTTKKKK